MKNRLYKMVLLTNMHVGSGEGNTSFVDKEVQRDVVTNVPIIRSSGLKGAFREFAKNSNLKNIDLIFGSGVSSDDRQAGKHIFYDAKLLAMPARSNVKPYYLATSKDILSEFIEFANALKIDIETESIISLLNLEDSDKPIIFEEKTDVEVELNKAEYKNACVEKIEALLSGSLVLLNTEAFKELVSDLPVIARNNLENGESKNLWYEEVVPRKSVFYFAISGDESDLSTLITDDLLQVGANASIGYGVAQITMIGES